MESLPTRTEASDPLDDVAPVPWLKVLRKEIVGSVNAHRTLCRHLTCLNEATEGSTLVGC